MAVLDDVKTLLGFSDESMSFDEIEEVEEKLNVIIGISEKRLLAYLPADVTEVPEELEYIVEELTVARFNRIGNENMSSYSQEGETISYNSDDMAPYIDAITSWCANQEEATKGVVMFI